MTYLNLSELKETVKPTLGEPDTAGEDYFQTHPEPEFEELLTRLEKQSRAIINGQIKGEGYERETDRVDTQNAPGKPELQLVRPIDTVSKVEVTNKADGTWTELDTELYSNDEQSVRLRSSLIPNQFEYWNVQNPLKRNSNRAKWSDIADRVRVTYDRGYTVDNIGYDIKEVQREIIRRILVHLRQEQNLANLSPDNVNAFNQREILTEDIQNRINQISQNKHKYTMMR